MPLFISNPFQREWRKNQTFPVTMLINGLNILVWYAGAKDAERHCPFNRGRGLRHHRRIQCRDQNLERNLEWDATSVLASSSVPLQFERLQFRARLQVTGCLAVAKRPLCAKSGHSMHTCFMPRLVIQAWIRRVPVSMVLSRQSRRVPSCRRR